MFKVLIVDDEPAVIQGLCKQIEWDLLNMEIVGEATSGQDALAIMAENSIQLLITDVRMPGMDGLELISKAKCINDTLRCIIMSAYGDFEYVKKALQLGVENYLLKPINRSEMIETLSKTLENLERDQIIPKDTLEVLAFRTNILNRWVNDSIQDYELYERAELLNIDLTASEYVVCVLDVIQPLKIDFKLKYSLTLLEICRNIMHSTLGGEYFIDGSFRVVIILKDCSLLNTNIQKDMDLLLKQIHVEAVMKGIRLFSSVGPISKESTTVSTAYSSAVLHLYYRFLDPTSTVVFGEGFSESLQETSIENQTRFLQIERALRYVDYQQAMSYLEKYLLMYSIAPFPRFRASVLEFVLSVIRIVIESGRPTDVLPDSISVKLSNFVNIRSNIELKNWLIEIIRDSLKVIHERKGSLHMLVRRTLEQINKNYNKDISLKMLAAEYKVRSDYLGKLFKEETGNYFNDYLTLVRLQESKNLLLSTDLKISEIINRVGIANQSYYNRIFKKIYGTTPVLFRREGN